MSRTTVFLARLRPCALAVIVSLLAAGLAGAQSPTGSIQGTVVDSSGALLPGVTVTLTNSETGAARTVVTDSNGLFAMPLLPVGIYEIAAELAGFSTKRQPDVRLNVGQTLTLRIEMAVAGLAETVTVSGATPIIETSRTQVSSIVNETAIQNLPVNGRNFIDFALLTPGVTRDVRTGDISFAGQRGTLNSLVVDGADNNNTFFGQTAGRTGSGRAPYQFSQDAVKEFQVNSNSFSAEYGRAGGAVINVVTKSGTNELHGSAFEFYRDKGMNANNAINELNNRPKSPYHYNQFGGTLGGPIVRNRHFYFANYDGQRNTQPNLVFPQPAGEHADRRGHTGRDRAPPAAGRQLGPETGSGCLPDQDRSRAERGQSADVPLQPSELHRRGIRERRPPERARAHRRVAGENAQLQRELVQHRDADRSSTSCKFQYPRDKEPGEANSDNPEGVVQQAGTTVLTIGRNNFSPRETTIDRWQIADSLTYVRGLHKFKGGFDFQFDDILNRFPGFFSGSYTFRSLASFAGGRPIGANESYQQNFAGSGTSGAVTNPNIHEYSFFVQDEWKPRSAVTLNLGLRYDLMKTAPPPVKNPDPQLAAAGIDTSRFDADTNNFGPRLGVAWSPVGKPFVVRGGWGLFYGRTPSIMLGTAHSNNGINIVSLTFTGDAVPTYPENFDAIPAGGTASRPTIFYIDQDFANAQLMQANAAVEWQFARDASFTVTYLFVDGNDLPRSIDRNLGSLGSRTFTLSTTGAAFSYPFFGADRPFGNFQRVIAFESTAESRFNGITFELNRRYARNWQLRIAYTLGKVVDTVPDATAVVPGNAGDDVKYASNPADFDTDRTVGNNDQRHRFVLSGVYNTNGVAGQFSGLSHALSADWSLSAIFTAQSGQPYTARVGAVDLNNDGNTRNDIAPGTTRNQFRLSSIVTLDPRISREIPFRRDENSADLGGVQPVEPRQHQRRGHDLLQRYRHDAHTGDDLRPTADERRRAHHAAGCEGDLLTWSAGRRTRHRHSESSA